LRIENSGILAVRLTDGSVAPVLISQFLGTVQYQYTRGPFAIASWAHIVNAHIFPGPAIITALESAAENAIQSLRQGVSTEIFADGHRGSVDETDSDDVMDEDETARVARRPLAQSGRKGSVITTTSNR
jgi:hypothetical protein